MAAQNPYRKPNPDKFEIVYEGEADGYHCFRIRMVGHKGLDALMFKGEVSDWLKHEADGQNFLGNGFGDSKLHPKVPFENPTQQDIFVLMDDMIDIVRFEDRFPVTGYSPSLTA